MRSISRLILSAVFAVVTVMLAAIAIYLPEVFFPYYKRLKKNRWYRKL